MDKSKFYAIRATSIGRFITLLIIGIIVFRISSQQLTYYLTFMGESIGQGVTIGIFMLASVPLIIGIIVYYFCLWVLQ